MANQFKKIISNENGVTIVEVIASFVLLVVVVSSFFMLYVQTAKTGKSSETIVDATYLAQTEMEKIFKKSTEDRNNPGLNLAMIKESLAFKPVDLSSTAPVLFQKSASSYLIILKIRENKNNTLKNIVIEVTEGTKLKSKMETVVQWRNN